MLPRSFITSRGSRQPAAEYRDGVHESVAQPSTLIKALQISRLLGRVLDDRGEGHDAVL